MSSLRLLLAFLFVAALGPRISTAQLVEGDPLEAVGIDQRPGAQLPLDARFRDSSGREVRLGELFGERPVVVAFVYYACPRLCGMVESGLVRALKPLKLDVGRDLDVVAISIAPDETPRQAALVRARDLDLYGRDGAAEGWRCLVGDEDAVRAATAAAGFRYVRGAEPGTYAHAAALVVATPDGRISRYLLGVDYAPRDLRLAAVEASGGEIGGIADAVLLLCFHYDPTTGRYGFAIQRALRVGGALTVFALAGAIVALSRRAGRERRRAEGRR